MLQVGALRGKYRQKYSQDQLRQALHEVRENGMPKKKAAKLYGIPKTTLLDKLSGRVPDEAHSGPDSLLSKAEEDRLARYIRECARVSFPLDKRDNKLEIKKLLDADNRNVFKNNMPGKYQNLLI